MTIFVSVTRACINEARRREANAELLSASCVWTSADTYWSKPSNCPIAIALHHAGYPEAFVGPSNITLRVHPDFLVVPTPGKVAYWMAQYDSRQIDVMPFDFILTLPTPCKPTWRERLRRIFSRGQKS